MLQNLLKTSLFILSLVLATSLLGSSSANAQSAYDDTIQVTDTLRLKNTYTNTEFDLSYTLGQTILDNCSTNQYNYFYNVTTQYDDGFRWAITNRTQLGTSNIEIDIITNSMDGVTTFNRNLHFYQPPGDNRTFLGFQDAPANTLTIRLDNNNTIDCVYSTQQNIANSTNTHPFVNTFTVPYPPNYTGELIPDTVEPPQEPEKIGVSIRGSVAEDIVQVEWYNDPTNPKPEEAQGMYLVLHNINFDEIPPECSNDDIQEWRHSLDEIAIFNPVPCYGMWYVQSYYTSDPQGQNIIPNTDKTNLNLRIDGGSFYFDYSEVEYDEDGSIISPPLSGVNMADCVVFTEGLPYVEFDYQGCFSNIQKFIGIASTNNANVSRQFENIAIPAHQACGSFTKFNNLLHISDENNWICPQITEELRQPITLFAVFLLYSVAMFGWFYLMSGRVK